MNSDPWVRATLELQNRPDGTLRVVLAGAWRMGDGVPPSSAAVRAVRERAPARVVLDAAGLSAWDGTVLALAERIAEAGAAQGIPVDRSGLPPGAQRLLERAARAPEGRAPAPTARESLLARIGAGSVAAARTVLDGLEFTGDLVRAIVKALLGRAHIRRRDVLVQMQICGAQALGIVTLVAFLVGAILAFVGSVELRVFGAEIYVANLVGVAMVRELGALMIAFVIAGRTGAAFAAELGSMRVSQELDALATLGIPAAELLVAPRVLALTLMLPLLTIYADFVGVLGGGLVAVTTLGLSPELYFGQTMTAVTAVHFWGGLGKATVYGLLVAAAGCRHGLRSGKSAAGVGEAATGAVVSGIVQVIAACGVFAVIFFELGW